MISCIVPRDFTHNRLFGLDAELLVQRGLVETMMVGAGHGDPGELNDDLSPVEALKALGRQVGVKVYAGGSQGAAHGKAWVGDLKTLAQRMAGILDAGLDGGWFWDAEDIFHRNGGGKPSAASATAQPSTASSAASGRTPRNTTCCPFTTCRVTRYSPWNAY